MTQAQLAEAVGVLRTSVTNVEAGRQKLPLHLLYKMCITLDVEIASIVPSNEEVIGQPALPFGIYRKGDDLPSGLAEILEGVGE